MQVFERICDIIHEVADVPAADITQDSALNVDKLDLAEIILNVEEEFDILVEDEDSITTIGDLVALASVAVA